MQMGLSQTGRITLEEDWKITCHEAGHAVVGIHCKIPVDYVIRGQGEEGRVDTGVGPIENPDKPRSQDDIAHWQLFYAAGAAAEVLLFDGYREEAASRDRLNHSKLEKRRHNERHNGWVQDIQEAVKILDCESVLKITQALHQARELNGVAKLRGIEVCEILGREPPW
jgi:hypothetical protein